MFWSLAPAPGGNLTSFWSLSLVLFLAVTVPLVFSRFRRWQIPAVVGEILAGIVVGRSGLGWVKADDPVLALLSEIGFVFLMFLAGMEIDLSALGWGGRRRGPKGTRRARTGPHPLVLAVTYYGLTLVLAGLAGLGFWRMGLTRSPIFMGLLISTTSLDLALMVLKERGLLSGRYGQTLFVTALISDFVTMLLITVQVAVLSKGLTPEILLVGLLFVALFVFYRLGNWALPGLRPLLEELAHATTHIKVRLAFWLFVAFVALAEVLGVEVILGAFLAGMLISMLTTPEDHETRHQLESIGYGFFVPIFFIMVGAKFNLSALAGGDSGSWLLLPLLLIAAVGTKVVPAVVFRRAFSWRESLAGGVLLSARLSLIIAAAEIGVRLGVVDEAVVSAVVLIAVLSVILAPMLFGRLVGAAATRPKRRPIIVVGGGHLGTHLAAQLQEQGEMVVLFDEDPARVERARKHGLAAIVARAGDDAAAEHLERAVAVVITRSDPDTALQWARWARGHFGIERVLVLHADAPLRDALLSIGAVPITPLEAQSTFLSLMARNPQFLRMLVSTADRRVVRAVPLRNPEWHGRRLRELDWPPEVLVLTIQREGEHLIPRGSTRLQQGDVLTLLGTPEALEELEPLLRAGHGAR